MCSSFTWGTVSVHYLLGLPLAYALRSATPNGLMLLVKLTYSPVMLRPIDSFFRTNQTSTECCLEVTAIECFLGCLGQHWETGSGGGGVKQQIQSYQMRHRHKGNMIAIKPALEGGGGAAMCG